MLNFKVSNRVTHEGEGQSPQYQITMREVKDESGGNTPSNLPYAVLESINKGREAINLSFGTNDPELGEQFVPGAAFTLRATETAKPTE